MATEVPPALEKEGTHNPENAVDQWYGKAEKYWKVRFCVYGQTSFSSVKKLSTILLVSV